jgi:chaperonin GroEL
VKLVDGANKLANIVKITMGAMGRTVAVDNNVSCWTTKDGYSITQEFNLKDQEEMAGARLLRQAAKTTVQEAGDGTTGTIVIAQSFINNKLDRKEIDAIEAELQDVYKQIDLKKKRCGFKEAKKVALIASNQDYEIADKACEAIKKNGVDGLYLVEESHQTGIQVEYSQGFSFNSGYMNPIFANTAIGAVIKNPHIIIKEDYSLKDVAQELTECIQSGKAVVIFGRPDDQMLQSAIVNHQAGKIQMCLVSPAGSGRAKEQLFDDIRSVCAGGVSQIIVKKHATIIEHQTDLTDYIEKLKKQDFIAKAEQEENKERVARLESRVAILRIGADSTAELRERKDRLDDTILSTMSAIKDGYVDGAGKCLYDIAQNIKNKILRKALESPYRTILENAELKASGKLVDVLTGKEVDALDSGIIDSAGVIKSELKNAWSVAKEFLKLGGIILKDK